jgi:nitroreductase
MTCSRCACEPDSDHYEYISSQRAWNSVDFIKKGGIMDIRALNTLLSSRASHRKFAADPVPEGDIRLMIENARLAPSGHNNQPWRYIAVTNRELINKMADAVVKNLQALYPSLPDSEVQALEKYKFFLEHFREAPLVMAILVRRDEYTTTILQAKYHVQLPKAEHFDMELLGVGATVENLLLVAQAMGYGSCWMTEPITYAQKALEDILNVKAPYHVVSIVPIGKPTKERKCAPKKNVDELLQILS